MPTPLPEAGAAAGVWPATLDEWLARCERAHPVEIDLGLDRVREVRERMDLRIETTLVSVAGTNGKGSTCAMLEAVALAAGYRVGLYSKPHLVHFEERCRVNGAMVRAEQLVPHFEAVERARGSVTLTYFEFTTLAIASLLAHEKLDLVILEVGLGGRLDAVNVFDADCAVITSIDIDHTEYLGHDRERIGFEKAGILRPGKPAILSDPVPPQSIVDHARTVGADLWQIGRDFNYAGDKLQWNWAGRTKRFNAMAYPALRGANQLLNASGALAAFEALRERLPITAQAARNGLALVELPGRFQIVAGQPTLVLDVAHNPHAVATLVQNLDQMAFFPRTHVVLGVMRDKDIDAIFTRLAPITDHWHFTDLPPPRGARAQELAQRHAALQLKGPGPVTVACHAEPREALDAALSQADPADRIVVLGSFQTVGGVLKDGLPRLTGKHAV